MTEKDYSIIDDKMRNMPPKEFDNINYEHLTRKTNVGGERVSNLGHLPAKTDIDEVYSISGW